MHVRANHYPDAKSGTPSTPSWVSVGLPKTSNVSSSSTPLSTPLPQQLQRQSSVVVHRGIESSIEAMEKLRLSVGSDQNVSGSTYPVKSNGKSNRSATSKRSSDSSDKRSYVKRCARIDDYIGIGTKDQIITLPLPNPSWLNVKVKTNYINGPLLCIAGIQPWKAYVNGDQSVPMGWASTTQLAGRNAIYGYNAAGTSNDLSFLLTDLQQATSTSDAYYRRISSMVFIKRIKVKVVIQRNALADTTFSGATVKPCPTVMPIVTSYIQCQPVPFEATQTDFSTTTCYAFDQAYPPIGYKYSDFLLYSQSNGRPTVNASGVISYGDPVADKWEHWAHRNPNIESQTVIHSLKRYQRNPVQPPIYGTLGTNFGSGEQTAVPWDGDKMIVGPQTETLEHDVHFPGKGLQVNYQTDDSTGKKAVCNPCWFKYHQDITGMMFEGPNSSGVLVGNPTTVYTHGYNEFIGLEAWVEFEDAPTELDL